MSLLPFLQVGASILGSVMGSNSANKANDRAAADSALNRKLQLDTLKNQIQWKVEDAKKAGISPLAALGSVPYSYSPVSSNFQPYDYSTDFQNIGQDLTRAIQAGGTARQRVIDAKNAVIQGQADALSLENMGLQNDLLRSQIARFNSAQIGPPMPEFRQEGAPPSVAPGSILDQPSSVVVGSRGEPARQPGELTDYQFVRSSSGGYSVVPSYDVKQRVEDMPGEWQWFLRNGVMPPANIYQSLARQHPPRAGYQWVYNSFTGEFREERVNNPGRRLYEFFIRPDLYNRR